MPRIGLPRRLRPVALALGLALGVAPRAGAVAINVDFGTTFGTPSSGYAAAGVPGFWNGIDPTDSGPHALLDIGGLATAVTLSISAGEGLFFDDGASTSGDDEALLDDELDVLPTGVGGTATLTISGLPADEYEVFTYARDAQAPENETVSVDVNGAGGQIVQPTGPTFSGFVLGETHALHTVTLLAGQDLTIEVTIQDDTAGDFGMINGIQIVPEPRTALLLWGGLALLAVWRRRA